MKKIFVTAAIIFCLTLVWTLASAGPFPESVKIRKWSHEAKQWEVGWPGKTLKENGVSITKEQLADFVLWGYHHGLNRHLFVPMEESDPGVPFVFAVGTRWEAVVLMPFGWTVFHIVKNHQLRDDMFPQVFKDPKGVNLGAVLHTRKDWTGFFNIASTFDLFIFHKWVDIDPETDTVTMEPPIGLSWKTTLEEAAMEMTHNPRVNDETIKQFYDMWNLYGKGFAQGEKRWAKKEE